MYGENGAQMRAELAALLRQHRIMRRLAQDSSAERAAAGQQILRFRQTVLVWCAQAIGAARPLTFPNVPQKPADPFRARSGPEIEHIADGRRQRESGKLDPRLIGAADDVVQAGAGEWGSEAV